MAEAAQNIIIKKIKKGGHDYHGGAWKVAYADFVTAMMAFFLLMWLLNATEAENLAGLADYFAPTVGVQGEMGIGFRGGKSALSSGIGADRNTNRGVVFGGVPSGPITKVTEKREVDTEEEDAEQVVLMIGTGPGNASGTVESEDTPKDQKLARVAKAVEQEFSEMGGEFDESVEIVQTKEGLEIDIHDTSNLSMFEGDTANLRAPIKEALGKLADIVKNLPNYLSITGHTSALALSGNQNYGNWELSAARANATRRFLIESGIEAEQIARIVGKADTQPRNSQQPNAAENNRITILLLREAAISLHRKAVPGRVFLNDIPTQAPEEATTQENTEAPQERVLSDEEAATQEALGEALESIFSAPQISPDNAPPGEEGSNASPEAIDNLLFEESLFDLEE